MNLNVIESLPKLLQMNNFELEQATLQLLFNLSFDPKLRDTMIRVGFLQKLTSLLSKSKTLLVSLTYKLHTTANNGRFSVLVVILGKN